jgi:anti-sigma-K factor RskA
VNSCNQNDNVAAYALGCMERTEREQFERHLAECQVCQADLRAYQSVVNQLALAAPMQTPPVGLRHSILQKAASQPVSSPKHDALGSRLRLFFQSRQPAMGIVGLVLIVILVFSSLFLLRQVNQLQQAQATPFHMVTLHSPDPQQEANALLVISDNGQFGTLVTDNLIVLNDQQQYQLWLIKDGKRTSGGLFTVNSAGYGWLKIESKISLLEFQSFGITIEPLGGSPGPTGPKVLGGNL